MTNKQLEKRIVRLERIMYDLVCGMSEENDESSHHLRGSGKCHLDIGTAIELYRELDIIMEEQKEITSATSNGKNNN